MPISIPAALQAVLWPLVGAVLVVALNRLLPNWVSRLLALAASIASLVALLSLGGQESGGFQGMWEPFTFLRTSPALHPTRLGWSTSLTLAAWSAFAALGVRGSRHPKTTWYGLNLVLLAGGVLMALAANLLTLVFGSALLDLALLLMSVSAVGGAGQEQRVSFRMCVPGVVSTGLLILAALRMDSSTGTLSLLAQGFSPQVLALLAASGLFRLAVFPLHPRCLSTPEQAAGLVLSMGAGVFVLARARSLGGVPAGTPWFFAIAAIAVAAGGWLVWSAGRPRGILGRWAETWSSLAIQQAGSAVLFVFLFPEAALWPLLGLVLALGLLAVWWDAMQASAPGPAFAWTDWIGRQWSRIRERLHAMIGGLSTKRGEPHTADGLTGTLKAESDRRLSALTVGWGRLRGSWLAKRGAVLLPAVALASLAGVPLTAGSRVRWHLYGALLAGAHPLLLAALWTSDAFLAGGLILAWKGTLRQTEAPRPRWSALGTLVLLAASSIALWLAPFLLSTSPGLPTVPRADVSAWGIGLLFILPWLLGAWLAKVAGPTEDVLGRLRRIANLERLFRPAEWLGRKLLTAVYWLGSVGEGEGWWGWALIVLALGALYLVTG